MAPNTPVWSLEPHTKAKHELLRRYLGAWYPIMASSGFRKRIVFLDGFAGPGIYSGGEIGSPIIALKTLIEHPQFPRWSKTDFPCIFFEADTARHARLEHEIANLVKRVGGLPRNVRPITVNTTFAEGAQDILDELGDEQLAPTFAFVDPFGFDGVSMQLICRLLAYDRCEVFFNFMYDQLNRWITHPNRAILGKLEDLFGTSDFEQAAVLSGEPRRKFLHDLYRRQLSTTGGFRYVQSFEMIDGRNRTAYYLFYGTRDLTGIEKMKDAMWKVDPSTGVRFSDRLAGQEVFFGEDNVDVSPLRQAILRRFRGEIVSIEVVKEFVLAETPFSGAHYKKLVLKPLEADGVLDIVQPKPGRRKGTYPDGTIIRFSE